MSYIQSIKEGTASIDSPCGAITGFTTSNYLEGVANALPGSTGGFTVGVLAREDYRNPSDWRAAFSCASDLNHGWFIFKEGDAWKGLLGKSGDSNVAVTLASMPSANMPPLYMKAALIVLRVTSDNIATLFCNSSPSEDSAAFTYVPPAAGTKPRIGYADGFDDGFSHGAIIGSFYHGSALTNAQVRELQAKVQLIGDMGDGESFSLDNLYRAADGYVGAGSTWTPTNGTGSFTKHGSLTYNYTKITLL